jgi:integrase/recombinase XerD
VGLAVVRDLREVRAPAGEEEIERFETDVVAGFVLARAAAGLSDSTIRGDVSHLEQVRSWFGRPLCGADRDTAETSNDRLLAAPGTHRRCRWVLVSRSGRAWMSAMSGAGCRWR